VAKTTRIRIIDGADHNHASRTVSADLLNISGGGLMIGIRHLEIDGLHLSFAGDMKVRNFLALELSLVPGRPIRALGKVAWYQKASGSSQHRYDVGVEFTQIGDEDRQAIIAFIEKGLSV
jgi:hypothetical protein